MLIGHSAGGVVAHAVAGRLERRGIRPSAVVVLDSYRLDGAKPDDGALAGLLPELVRRHSSLADGPDDPWGDAWITATARYLSFRWDLGPLRAPGLLVRAAEPLDGAEAFADWTPVDTTLRTDGDHFTMLEQHSDRTAELVDGWLRTTLGKQ